MSIRKKLAEGYYSRMAVDKSDDAYLGKTKPKSDREKAAAQVKAQYGNMKTKGVTAKDWERGSHREADIKEGFQDDVHGAKSLSFHAMLDKHGFTHSHTNKEMMGTKHEYHNHIYKHPNHGKSSVTITHYMDNSANRFIHRHEQSNGILAPSTGDNANQLHRSLSREYGVPKGMKVPKLTAWEKSSGHAPKYKQNEDVVTSLEDLQPILEAYSKVAVDKAIQASTRGGKKIGKKEAALIHRLLQGRHNFRGDDGKIVKESLKDKTKKQLARMTSKHRRAARDANLRGDSSTGAAHMDKANRLAKRAYSLKEHGSDTNYVNRKRRQNQLKVLPIDRTSANTDAMAANRIGNMRGINYAIMTPPGNVKESRISPAEAHAILTKHDAHKDFFALSSSQVSGLLDHAKANKYRKGKNAPGSTGRMFHQHLRRLAGHMSEEVIFEAGKKTKTAKAEMKRKYLGKSRGTTMTGKTAHEIITQPVLGKGNVK